ncbi:hypothetical protein Acr_00g0048550 [Actinidia rufa]|uniref:Uncharacterized protein n=1 Tax=Actinidia rufa TaxID=165716 RepID=A0A7J0DLX3_9ERIC|nr:hypothetical protein Acr_00g0048550 [Actinidia rufa]
MDPGGCYVPTNARATFYQWKHAKHLPLLSPRSPVAGGSRLNRHAGEKLLILGQGGKWTEGEDYGGSRVVDENMIILRMRIRQAEVSEGRHEVLSNWMEWEKKYYAQYYNEDVCEGVGLLQSFLMNTRPCLALGMGAILALSVPISSFVVIAHAIEVAKWVLSGFLLCK